jgi:hypothetical protein
MHIRDLPFALRFLMAGNAILFGINALLFAAGVTAIASWLSATGGAHQAFWTLMGTIVGSASAFFITRHVAAFNRQNEANDIATSLHAEIADRAARCLNDFIAPWRTFREPAEDTKLRPRSWIGKFRPVDPIVYPSIGAKLGLLKPEAVFPVVQFYFRLDALRRELDLLLEDEDYGAEGKFAKTRGRLRLIATRFQSTLGPALLALEKLNVPNAARIEEEARNAYHYARYEDRTLRAQLAEHQD